MKTFKILSVLYILFQLSPAARAQNHIIPQPYAVKKAPGSFLWKSGGVIGVDKESEQVGKYLQQYLLDTYHLNFKVKLYQHIPSGIPLKLITKDLGVSAYRLNSTQKSLTIYGQGAGLFYGVQSLIQLLPDVKNKSFTIPAYAINDHPRFNWRGLSLDVSRHFFTVNEVKKYIDIMAHYKLNVFHWHLTDDEGWRIQIDKYPLLTSVASNMSYWEKQGKFRKLDNLITGGREGFYTKADIREVVRYAGERFITILPEIEMPGHSEAAIFAYPELGCRDSTGTKKRIRILEPSAYTFEFLQNVLTEVIDLFPGQYIHIGGDEAEMADWLNSPSALALIRKEHLANVKELQSYFIKRMERFLLSKNKKLVGWDEILQGGLAESATVMSWQGEKGGIAAARMHHPVVMTPLPYLYFDAPQASAAAEPRGWNDPVSWQMVYNYEPLPKELNTEEAGYIMGAQANVWTELIPTQQHLEYMVYPRLLALSELSWSQQADKNSRRFEGKMYNHYNLFKLWHLNARVPDVGGLGNLVTNKSNVELIITHPLKTAGFQYQTDGKVPNPSTAKHHFPLHINLALKDSLQLMGYTTLQGFDQPILQIKKIKYVKVSPARPNSPDDKPGLFFEAPKQGETQFSGYLKIQTAGDYIISSTLENSPLISLSGGTIIYKDKNKYADPQSALMHLETGSYKLTGSFREENSGTKAELIQIKRVNGKPINLSDYLVH